MARALRRDAHARSIAARDPELRAMLVRHAGFLPD